jgi:hypothetical protein
LHPDTPRYSYVYTVALHDAEQTLETLRVLEETHARHRYDREVLTALVVFAQEVGDVETVRRHAATLRALAP